MTDPLFRAHHNTQASSVRYIQTDNPSESSGYPVNLMISRGATFNHNETHRYILWRVWNYPTECAPRMRAYIGLNPSTADEEIVDPTVCRCVTRAMNDGFDGMFMLNLFAFRATDREEMKRHPEPIGSLNDWLIDEVCCHYADQIVCCWGVDGAHLGRAAQVLDWLRPKYAAKLGCLGLTLKGQPKHPLYLPFANPVIAF